MGSSSWSDDHYVARSAARKASGASAFSYSDDVVSKVPPSARKAHDKMDPKNVVRESRDSDAHPSSVPVAVFFDVTGSMGGIPRTLQSKLPKLMGMLTRRGFLPDAQILFGAVGDATCDRVPLQVGQFEAGIETDDDLSRIYLEGGGGGQNTESYELAMYWAANKTSCDAVEKRDKRGYLFIIADERPYGAVKRNEVTQVIGDNLQSDIPIADMVTALLDKWDTYILMPSTGGAHKNDKSIKKMWVDLFAQRVIEFDPEHVSETIAAIIGASEGFDANAIDGALDDVGSGHAKGAVGTAISTVKGGNLTNVTGGAIAKSSRRASLT